MIPCPKCKLDVEPVRRDKGPHIGLYCPSCDTWLKWGSKEEFGSLEPGRPPAQRDVIQFRSKIEPQYIVRPRNQIEPRYLEPPFDA